MTGMTIGKLAAGEGSGSRPSASTSAAACSPCPPGPARGSASTVFSGGEVVKQVIGAKSRSALLREFSDFT